MDFIHPEEDILSIFEVKTTREQTIMITSERLLILTNSRLSNSFDISEILYITYQHPYIKISLTRDRAVDTQIISDLTDSNIHETLKYLESCDIVVKIY